MAKKKAKAKAKTEKSAAKTAEDLAGEKAPKVKPEPKKKAGGKREGAGRPPKWEPEQGQTFSINQVMEEGLKSRDYGDKSDKAVKEAAEHERRANIMLRNLEPGALDVVAKAIINSPFNGAAFLTKWGGWKLKPDQEDFLLMVWEPTIRFYLPIWLQRWGHLALPFLLSLPIIMHKVKGYGEHAIEIRKQRTASMDRQRQGARGQDNQGRGDIPGIHRKPAPVR